MFDFPGDKRIDRFRRRCFRKFQDWPDSGDVPKDEEGFAEKVICLPRIIKKEETE